MTPNQFLEVIVSLSIQAAIIVCATHWLCKIVETPRLQCRLWGTCHGILLLLFLSGMVLPHVRVLHPWHALSPAGAEQLVIASMTAGRLALTAWILGAVVSLVLLAREWRRAFRFLESCRPADECLKTLIKQLEQLSGGAEAFPGGPPTPIRLLLSDQIGSPFCCQWHRPQLVLPSFMADCHPEVISCIARHELEHLRRGHPLQLFLERLVATAFWFHPMVWWAGQQASMAREFACDDAAATGRRQIVSYLKTLLAVAERGMSEEAEGAVLFFGRGASIIAMRGRRLLLRAETEDPERTSRGVLAAQTLLATGAIAASFVWAPLDALASSKANWSPWPRWSADALRALDVTVRDFEPYDERTRLHEMTEQAQRSRPGPVPLDE